ncbi:dTDP-4-amino-4,6-dideoxy-D-glucose acetyltransferase VioB [Pseudomonas syringae pv. actinidiae]|uniref:Acetyltransferase n=1 Tax=Pseudomonas syringae pv. actinidiae TaxID=103796 RepID=A0AAN4TKS1_PSESF|nr:dTDP-4-amino-4,6-dideoxy-D-glucose acetyltransferase VioB [Pseudomonas syringae]EPN61052.1 transferase, hexapeptide repeat protein [Pseudomonas syringae pv. actinidiae ICMP 19079]EPN78924.1 transferase, hexapeptide repeat protein [Pseudomonas syringae pv. actinidiae ICMP 19101]AKT29799.1 transferase [Pseudomonas syringae pv. actinidiae ICMP 18884]AOE56260.1 transferase [Pseudomonas syringae pv. actinidiae ICMP 18708]APP97221.1 transferase [Pseudomonas syringae pv. actinidiae]
MNVNRLLIVGAGAFGREVHAWLLDWVKLNPGWVIAGFINDGPGSIARFDHYPAVVSSVEGYEPGPEDYLVCAIAKPSDKRLVVEKLLGKGARFFTLIHPSVIMGENVVIGQGAVICPSTVLSVDLRIGAFVTLNIGCLVGHDADIGDFSTLSGHCDITGGVVLEEEVFMGTHASVLPNVKVGKQAVVGAGSVAIRNVAAGITVFGVPAKRISG